MTSLYQKLWGCQAAGVSYAGGGGEVLEYCIKHRGRGGCWGGGGGGGGG